MPDTCPKCHQPIQTGSQFCDNCGEKISTAPPVVPAWMNPVPPVLPKKPHISPTSKPVQPVSQTQGGKSAETPPVLPRISAVSGRIVVQSSGSSIPIPLGKVEVFMGRDDPVNNRFPEINLDPYQGLENGVSRNHACLLCENGQVFIKDLSSINGTYLHNQRLSPEVKTPINHGDEFILGRLKLIYYTR